MAAGNRDKGGVPFRRAGIGGESTHAGIPWLRYIRKRPGTRVHFWPFDGREIPARRSAIAEVYPALWSGQFAMDARTGDQHDAYSIAARLQQADANGELEKFLTPRNAGPDLEEKGSAV